MCAAGPVRCACRCQLVCRFYFDAHQHRDFIFAPAQHCFILSSLSASLSLFYYSLKYMPHITSSYRSCIICYNKTREDRRKIPANCSKFKMTSFFLRYRDSVAWCFSSSLAASCVNPSHCRQSYENHIYSFLFFSLSFLLRAFGWTKEKWKRKNRMCVVYVCARRRRREE